MADIGLNQKINAGKREFHIQTSTLVEDGVIRTEVFEEGRVLFIANHAFERRKPGRQENADSRLRHIVDKFHQSIIEEIDSLFEVSDRINEENSAAAHEKIGQVFLFSHIFDKAERHFKKALELEPKRYSAYVYLSRCYYLQKRFQQAYDILKKVLEGNIRYPDMFNVMGLVMLKKRNYRLALQNFKNALKLNPAYMEAYFNISEAILNRVIQLKRNGREADVKRSIDFLKVILKKIDSRGNTEDRKQSTLVKKALVVGDVAKALMLLCDHRENRLLRITPPEVIGYKFYLRLLYSEGEMSTEVLENYEQQIAEALDSNPSYPDLWQYLALIHLMQCRHFFLQGLDNFREATRINPQFERAVKNLRLVENDGREFLALINTIV